MSKPNALKKRYILFKYFGKPTSENQLKTQLYHEALKFFGEFGLSTTSLKIIEFNTETNTGIIRCERKEKQKVLAWLSLISSGKQKARIIPLKTSGSLKKLSSENNL